MLLFRLTLCTPTGKAKKKPYLAKLVMQSTSRGQVLSKRSAAHGLTALCGGRGTLESEKNYDLNISFEGAYFLST